MRLNRLHKRIIAILLLGLSFSGCGGRLDDSNHQKIDLSQYNLTPGKPALISFGALWCKPCREEIGSLNLASQDFSSQLQLVQYLVEGETEGTQPRDGDSLRFKSKDGILPSYRVDLDPDWKIFESLRPPKKALPLLVFVDGDGVIRAIVQRSFDYEAEMKPWLVSLLAGLPAPVEPTPPPAAAEHTLDYPTWVAASATHAPGSVIDLNFRAAWQKGLDKYSFDPASMPFEAGLMYERKPVGAPDFELVSGFWDSGSCQLTVSVTPLGEFLSARGICH